MKLRMTLMCLVMVCGLCASASGAIMGYWRLDEGSGDTVADISGNNNTGTIEGAVWVKGKSGAALEFDGVSNDVMVPDSPSLNTTTGDITIAAWVKVASDPSGWTGAASIIHKQGGYQWAVEPAGSLWFGIWGGALRSTGNYDFRQHLDEWHHVVATFVNATQAAELYVDGELNSQGSISAAVDATTNPLYLGWKQDGNNYFNGTIDEALVADTPYTQAEIIALMKANALGSGNPRPCGSAAWAIPCPSSSMSLTGPISCTRCGCGTPISWSRASWAWAPRM